MHTRLVGPAALALLLAALASGCGSSRGQSQAAIGGCTVCHGGQDNGTGAPPTGVNGDATGPAVGAHTAHVVAGVACQSCHVVPTRAGEPNHPDAGRAQVAFGGLALAGSAGDRARTGPPQYDPQTLTCSAVYCHGGTLDAGGTGTAPAWGQVMPPLACAMCHGYPPPAPHPDDIACSTCHGASVEADNVTFKPAHLNGTLNFN
jgi:predicted CxxxxCH...CXXCH cytochrome family protein